jgi:hypothetical protein
MCPYCCEGLRAWITASQLSSLGCHHRAIIHPGLTEPQWQDAHLLPGKSFHLGQLRLLESEFPDPADTYFYALRDKGTKWASTFSAVTNNESYQSNISFSRPARRGKMWWQLSRLEINIWVLLNRTPSLGDQMEKCALGERMIDWIHN